MSTLCSPFSSLIIMSNYSSIATAFCPFFTWIALGDVDFRFSLILGTNVNAAEEGTISAACLYHQCNQSTHVTDGDSCWEFIIEHTHYINFDTQDSFTYVIFGRY
jgi:hypothetical protein